MYSIPRFRPDFVEAKSKIFQAFAGLYAWCRTFLKTAPHFECEAFDLDVTGVVSYAEDLRSLSLIVTGGIERLLDADCNFIRSRPAVRATYSVGFTPYQIEAIVSTPLLANTLVLLEADTVKARLYVSHGRVEHLTIFSQCGSEFEWSNF